MNLKNKISTEEFFYLEEGKKKHAFFEADIEDALTNNVFGDHYIISSLPGTGKTETVKRKCQALNINMIKFEGSQGLFAFCADVATVLLNAPQDDSKIYCLFDDNDSLFEKGDNLNTMKGLFDTTMLTVRSPTTEASAVVTVTPTTAARLSGTARSGRKYHSSTANSIAAITPPQNPSQVLAGLTRAASLCLPNRRPEK